MQPLDPRLRGALIFGALAACLVLERLAPLRKRKQPQLKRMAINAGLAASASALVRFAWAPLVAFVATETAARGWGILPRLGLSRAAAFPLGFLALDYTLYAWHWLNHRVAFFWRFHNVHHVDLDLDATTALRFHFGELTLSAVYRSFQIILIGVDLPLLVLFETLITASAVCHHSNLRLPPWLDRALSFVVVTPRMHGVHHSQVQNETDSNYTALFTIWDRLHGTLRLRVPQEKIVIGVPAYPKAADVTLWKSLWLPFRKQRAWGGPRTRAG
ncbi:MAG: sterol desaturase family protein [Deltaproteobacteria bacterium]|nr:sterol desaturase family protein [Deltaproteobacteria bacterium]